MKRAARAVGGVKRKERVLSPVPVVSRQAYGALPLDARLELIRELIPLGLMYVREGGDPDLARHGTNPGSVKLPDKKPCEHAVALKITKKKA